MKTFAVWIFVIAFLAGHEPNEQQSAIAHDAASGGTNRIQATMEMYIEEFAADGVTSERLLP